MLYKDGELVREARDAASNSYETSRMYNEIVACDAGNWGPWGYFKGEIDQLSLWNIPLGSKQVKEVFEYGVEGDEPGLVGLWRFDEQGRTVNDSSSFKYPATLGRRAEPDASDPERSTVDASDWIRSLPAPLSTIGQKL